MFTQETIDEVGRIAAEFSLEAAALLAIAQVESGGVAFAAVDGRAEPLIRFEAHYFDWRLSAENRARARSLGLSAPHAGAIANPASQAARWRLLDRAAAIDRKAAFESTSWGLGQVMGAHWTWLGYASIDALVADARSGAAGQARLMARYIVKAGLADALVQRDWAAFARGYNGPAYRANRYDTKLARAYERHTASGSSAMPGASGDRPAAETLRRGSRGTVVADLQAALCAAGYPVAVDGAYGQQTANAVTRYQRDHDLTVDGIAGPLTLASLRASLSLWSRLRSFWAVLMAFLRNRAGVAA